jgi:hypothetical protein
MAVLIDTGPVEATQRLADVPKRRWKELVRVRRDFCAVNITYDCRELLHFVEDAHEMLEPLGYKDTTDFLRHGLELDPQMVKWALQGLERLKPDEPIPFQRAVELGKHGFGPGRGHKGKRVGITKSLSDNGSTKEYIMARLQRDGHADLLARIYVGDLSANAAAEQMGYRKKKTPLEQLLHWWKKASDDERCDFLKAIQ